MDELQGKVMKHILDPHTMVVKHVSPVEAFNKTLQESPGSHRNQTHVEELISMAKFLGQSPNKSRLVVLTTRHHLFKNHQLPSNMEVIDIRPLWGLGGN